MHIFIAKTEAPQTKCACYTIRSNRIYTKRRCVYNIKSTDLQIPFRNIVNEFRVLQNVDGQKSLRPNDSKRSKNNSTTRFNLFLETYGPV